MEVQGKIKIVGKTETVGSGGFTKRDIVVITDEQYPQHISIQFVQDKTELLNSYKVGQDVKISINLRGREWTSPQGEVKHFNTIQGWRIEKAEQDTTAINAAVASVDAAFEPAGDLNSGVKDDLPF
jgi:translation initiation factor IF-3